MIKRQDGIVIVAVLWICALIMWLALQIGAETRLQAEERVHLLRQSQAMYLAIGGAYEALARMGQPISLETEDKDNSSWQPDGKVREVNYATGRALVVIQKESEKVNVNKASQQDIKAVLEKAGYEEDKADALADVIADFIDTDESPRLHGAEKDYYEQQGFHHAPFDNALTSLDQLLLIPGITQQIFFGFDLNRSDENAEDSNSQIPVLSNEHSLFQMLTIYGNNVNLEEKEILEEVQSDYVPWEAGETYRILSCGKLTAGAPSVTLWLIVKYAPQSEQGYEVLYRKII